MKIALELSVFDYFGNNTQPYYAILVEARSAVSCWQLAQFRSQIQPVPKSYGLKNTLEWKMKIRLSIVRRSLHCICVYIAHCTAMVYILLTALQWCIYCSLHCTVPHIYRWRILALFPDPRKRCVWGPSSRPSLSL